MQKEGEDASGGEGGRKCAFGGANFSKDGKAHNLCDAAKGAGCHLFARCRCCKAAGGNPLWVCLACWANIAEAINGYVKEKEGTHRPIKDPVLDALCNTDFQALRAQAIDAKAKGVRQAGAALDPPLSSLHDV